MSPIACLVSMRMRLQVSLAAEKLDNAVACTGKFGNLKFLGKKEQYDINLLHPKALARAQKVKSTSVTAHLLPVICVSPSALRPPVPTAEVTGH